jgi:RHS repeat-associated protein
VTDANGHTSSTVYDANDRVIKRIDASCCGNETVYTYDNEGEMLSTIDANGHETSYHPNILGLVDTTTDAMQNASFSRYDRVGNQIRATDARGSITEFNYNARGELVSYTDALGNSENYSYDGVGNRITVQDRRGSITQYQYDPLNRLIGIIDALGKNSSYSYDALGNHISVTDKKGYTTTYKYDRLNRLMKETDPEGYTNIYTYDPNGNMVRVTDKNGYISEYEYDKINQLTTAYDPLGYYETYSYDPVGNLIGFSDKNGHTTTYEYDPLNRLMNKTDPELFYETYSYDAVGNLKSITDAKFHATQYTYDALNRHIKTISPMDFTTNYEYDENSNLKNITDPTGNTITGEYDALNRLTSKQYTDDSGGYQGTVTYYYDSNDNLLQVGGSGGVLHYDYDELNRVVNLTVDYGDYFSKEISYTYDNNGNIISMMNPDDEETLYTYDSLNRLSSILDPSAGFSEFIYDPAGRRMVTTLSDGAINYFYSYDSANRLLDITTGGIIPELSYSYDGVGNRLTMTSGSVTTTYTYDDKDELFTETSPTFSAVYGYDGVGNRFISSITNHLTVLYEYDNDNRLLASSNGITYGYDDNGNLIWKNDNDDITEYGYDIDNNLIEVLLPDSSTIEYTICPFGKRIAKTTDLGTEYYFYDRGNQLLKLDSTGETLYRYLQNPAVVDETLGYYNYNVSSWRFHAFDALGSIRFELESGTPVHEVRYDAYGNSFDPAYEPFEYGFTGRQYDAETGLYYYRARMYDPEVGRFTSKDPLGMADESNMYIYVRNNPVNIVDPSGSGVFSLYEYTCVYWHTSAYGPPYMIVDEDTCAGTLLGALWHDIWDCGSAKDFCTGGGGLWESDWGYASGGDSGGHEQDSVLPDIFIAAAKSSGGGGSRPAQPIYTKDYIGGQQVLNDWRPKNHRSAQNTLTTQIDDFRLFATSGEGITGAGEGDDIGPGGPAYKPLTHWCICYDGSCCEELAWHPDKPWQGQCKCCPKPTPWYIYLAFGILIWS